MPSFLFSLETKSLQHTRICNYFHRNPFKEVKKKGVEGGNENHKVLLLKYLPNQITNKSIRLLHRCLTLRVMCVQ